MTTMTMSGREHQQKRSLSHSLSLSTFIAALMINVVINQQNVKAFCFSPCFQKPTSVSNSRRREPHYIFFAQPNDDHRPEMAFERESPGSGSAGDSTSSSSSSNSNSSTITPKRTKKHKNRRKKMRRGKNTAGMKSGPLHIDDLAMHVTSQYISGPGGIFKQADARMKRLEAASLLNGRVDDEANKEQVGYLRKLDRHPTLVLNADYQPLSVLPLSLWSWQDTVKALFSGKVRVVETYPGISIRAVNMDVPLPSVIALTDFVAQPNQRPAFTRRNVFLRDGYKCQYCDQRYRTNDLSLDHVVPRCVGGKLEWENAVTCCKKCNSRKGSTLPNELRSVGMQLIREPRVPTKYELAAEAGKMVPRRVHPTWKPYLGAGTTVEEGEQDSRKFFEEDI